MEILFRQRKMVHYVPILILFCSFIVVEGVFKGITDRTISTDNPCFISVHNHIQPTPSKNWGVINKPYPTNSWFANLHMNFSNYPVTVFPYLVNTLVNPMAQDRGIVACYPLLKEQLTSYTSSWHDDFLFYMGGLSNHTIVDYTLLGVTTTWPPLSPNGPMLTVPWVPGSPYLTLSFNTSLFNISTVSQISLINQVKPITGECQVGKKFRIELLDPTTKNSQIWLLWALNANLNLCYFPNARADPSGLHPVLVGTSDAPQSQQTVIRVAILTDLSAEPTLDEYVSTIVVGGDVAISEAIDNDPQTPITFTWHAIDVNGNPSNTDNVLMLGLPHQEDCIDKSKLKMSGLLKNAYHTIKGNMTGYVGPQWSLVETLTDLQWFSRYPIEPRRINTIRNNLLKDSVNMVAHENDTYGYGKYISGLARLALIAEQLGDTATCQYVITRLKTDLTPWLNRVTFRATFLYDETWGGTISANGWLDRGIDYGNGLYNDHHYHNGYFIYAGAVVMKYDPTWEWGPHVLDLVRDIANPSAADPFFPVTRHKDWYCGHSWAQGLDYTLDGKNQESTSEAVNAYYAITLLGIATGNNFIKNIGRVLLATEIRSSQKYWHLTPQNEIYPPMFSSNGIVGIIWSDKADYATFFGNDDAFIHCIQMLPFTPISEDLLTPSWVRFEYPVVAPRLNLVIPEWQAYIVEDLAILDRDSAWDKALLLDNEAFLKGNSRTNLYWWIATRPKNENDN